ncbi:hypothetical protein niasHS_017267 [Heterodera schachtii]|uniref:Uncharacterized protein n=1 Tax=Heterodera schachtii TaxID=97005 RepID=A0ABD2I770_HETSC
MPIHQRFPRGIPSSSLSPSPFFPRADNCSDCPVRAPPIVPCPIRAPPVVPCPIRAPPVVPCPIRAPPVVPCPIRAPPVVPCPIREPPVRCIPCRRSAPPMPCRVADVSVPDARPSPIPAAPHFCAVPPFVPSQHFDHFRAVPFCAVPYFVPFPHLCRPNILTIFVPSHFVPSPILCRSPICAVPHLCRPPFLCRPPICAVPHFVPSPPFPLRFNYPTISPPQLTAKRPPPIAPALAKSGPLPANKLPSDIARSIASRFPDSPSSSRPPRLSTDRGKDKVVPRPGTPCAQQRPGLRQQIVKLLKQRKLFVPQPIFKMKRTTRSASRAPPNTNEVEEEEKKEKTPPKKSDQRFSDRTDIHFLVIRTLSPSEQTEVQFLGSTPTSEKSDPVTLSPETQKLLAKLKASEIKVQAKQLKKAINCVEQTVKTNQNADLLQTTNALKKFNEIRETTPDQPNFHSNFAPEIDNGFLEKLTTLEDERSEIWSNAVKECKKQEERRVRSVELQTNNILESVAKAIRAEDFNRKILEELLKTVQSTTYATRAARDKTIICAQKLQNNLLHQRRFLTAQERTATFIRKTFGLPTGTKEVGNSGATTSADGQQ